MWKLLLHYVVDEWDVPRDSVRTTFNSSTVGISFSKKNTHVII